MAELAYEVSFKGVASSTLRAAFPDCQLATGAGLTLMRCNRSSLPDVLGTIEELALQLLGVRLVAEYTDEQRAPRDRRTIG
jgi:hypothetical protein